MSEVREQAPHAATLGIQRGEISEWNFLLSPDIRIRRLRLHAQLLRLPLGIE